MTIITHSPAKLLLLAPAMLVALAMPLTAHADASEAVPISPAVNDVLRRVDAQVEYARTSGVLATYFFEDVDDFYKEEASTVFVAIDTEQQIVQRQRTLPQGTACLRYDAWLIEQKMTEVRQYIDAAEDGHDIFDIFHLEEAYNYLSKEYDEFTRGALTMGIRDQAWDVWLSSEDQNESTLADELCYYNSDYTTASIADRANADGALDGYGCDKEMLDHVLASLPPDAGGLREATEKEAESMMLAQTAVQNEAAAAEGFTQLLTGVDDLVGGRTPEDPAAALPQRVHKNEAGCDATEQPGIIGTELRGPFSLLKDHPRLAQQFPALQRSQDEQRTVPESLLITGQGSSASFDPAADSTLSYDFNQFDRQMSNREFTAVQTALESATFEAGADPWLSTQDNFAPLRSSIRALVRLGNELSTPSSSFRGLRDFVRDFAYFLDRSCRDRPCGERLNRVLRLVFTNECFVYGNGKYRDTTGEQWQACLCAADPQADGCPGL